MNEAKGKGGLKTMNKSEAEAETVKGSKDLWEKRWKIRTVEEGKEWGVRVSFDQVEEKLWEKIFLIKVNSLKKG